MKRKMERDDLKQLTELVEQWKTVGVQMTLADLIREMVFNFCWEQGEQIRQMKEYEKEQALREYAEEKGILVKKEKDSL
jgi:hypothetical protein